MPRYRYRLLNVFSIGDDMFSGNPLCVFEDARGLSDAQMQSLALQFNLSETTFILPSKQADARVRIFTPTFEMPFAGHPTLGTAQVVRTVLARKDALQLELGVGIVAVTAEHSTWTLQAPTSQARTPNTTPDELAQLLGIAPDELAGPALWVNAGNEQLLVPVKSQAVLDRCSPSSENLRRYAGVNDERSLVYAFADLGNELVAARLFFNKGTSVVEDPATGSACANLGGYLLHTGHALPLRREVDQGRAVRRPSRLLLHVDAAARIFVSGAVRELGEGYVELAISQTRGTI